MTTAEILLSVLGSIVTLLIGIGWVGSVLIKRIEAKRDLDLKSLDKDGQKVVDLKAALQKQNDTIKSQNETILALRHQVSAMQLKISIIVPMLRKVLRDDPDNAEILDHLENFETGNTTP